MILMDTNVVAAFLNDVFELVEAQFEPGSRRVLKAPMTCVNPDPTLKKI